MKLYMVSSCIVFGFVLYTFAPRFHTKIVWDTLDGEGYQFKETTHKLDPRFNQLAMLPACNNLKLQKNVLSMMRVVKKEFLACIKPIVAQWKGRPNEMNLEWVEKTVVCDNLQVFKNFEVEQFNNQHETKWTILPKCKEENILVTLGVGHDTIAEELLSRTLPNTTFYGADPIYEPNRQLYSAFGKFFPFAIGKEPGFTKFRVLPNQNQKTREYVYQDVTTIPFLYFLHDILKLKKIDFAWIDIEGGEFEFLDKFHRDVQICQFNIEIHSKFAPTQAQAFHDFIFRVLKEQKYVFMKTMLTDAAGVHRMFFVNVQDEECLAKYFNDF
ncbi:Methyltransferase FkbM domain-containing protein [Caenorhabditis elegans]|uniref:Methyltransferase FkbM domain-containing protein n=1 Tax=Caenorhabditis elegans TaxID=6239 RepID=O02318_CAEEL|nr:Methyltransferase FkbM domain-containing protein [Caenorhabditis elegans]CAB05624.2 Methyltransferase FkbM domain-containing protein [Caenorhabditis elegans]|eukprot:NP_493142.2 Uncharacterized protein CELE_T15D6.11 [Caenorhabditis elegans]